jgi:OPA family glycerol-3-phosphate transporter-like MFS transporter
VSTTFFTRRKFPAGFRARRGLNWGIVGLMYTSFYLCRYNLPLANKAIADEFHFSKSDMSSIISAQLLAYAIGQIVNGLLTDRLGGKRAMLIGAAGTVTMNLLFGASSFWGFLWLFVVLRSIDGYVQAFGAPGFIKINASWFGQTERGTFAGIFGFMINLGRLGINYFGAALLAGFTFLGMWQVPALHWRWLFWIPAGVASLVAVVLALVVKDTPEEAGFAGVHGSEADHSDPDIHGEIATVFKRIVGNPLVWIIALAYACTGAVRQCIDQWFPRYFQEVYNLELSSARFQWLGFLIPFVASSGSLISGIISDRLFQGRRAPVAAWIYFIEVGVILVATQVQSLNWALVFFVLISFTANSTHSLLGPAAAMDIGGRKMAGFASGVIDSFQYFGASLALKVLGYFLDKSWDSYFYFMVPFGVIGGLLMFAIRNQALDKNRA